MKRIISYFTTVAMFLMACNNGKPSETTKSIDSTLTNTEASNTEVRAASNEDVLMSYIQLKNELANDNSDAAGAAGKSVSEAIQKMSSASLTSEQQKVYISVKDDIQEHGEHISKNTGKIEHQRMHFEMLTDDIYDLVKAFGNSKTLYYDHCPMYNDGKGANWLSEVKEIKNPYLGKEMLTCGTVEKEIK